ncbi:hypothetical protein Agub_g12009 [Astrephomene gubernaculifera]|uniref:DUF7912 domain-containing protein n=1 Tax=Astrephomene gubernaculifera TaxID=47775 RepID=A0AAD3DXV7_9CHLO|nr:hypothetical protein Agub_g12009 [Astrephomene gubernaculifera]
MWTSTVAPSCGMQGTQSASLRLRARHGLRLPSPGCVTRGHSWRHPGSEHRHMAGWFSPAHVAISPPLTTCAARSPRHNDAASSSAPSSQPRSSPSPSSASSSSSSTSRKASPRGRVDDEEEEEEEEDLTAGDGFLNFGDEDEEDEEEADADADFGEEGDDDDDDDDDEDDDGEGGEDYASSFLEPDDAPREVLTGDTGWGEAVLRAAQGVLAQPNMQGLDLYLFRALPGSRKVDIRLDKLTDLYGSPSIDDIERFQRGLMAALERDLGAEAAGDISFEVSSPGAERLVRVPEELRRFGELPLRVEYRVADGAPQAGAGPGTAAAPAAAASSGSSDSSGGSSGSSGARQEVSAVLLLADLDESAGRSEWRLANVRANATVKGRALSKRQLAQRLVIPLSDILRVRIHVDF